MTGVQTCALPIFGLPLAQSLATVQDQTSSKMLKVIVADLVGGINGGMPLSDAMAKYPKVFNQVYVALVRAGETSGTLDQALARLANQQEHDYDQISKIRDSREINRKRNEDRHSFSQV